MNLVLNKLHAYPLCRGTWLYSTDKWQVELACKQTNDFIDSMAILECQSFLLGSSPLISATYTGRLYSPWYHAAFLYEIDICQFGARHTCRLAKLMCAIWHSRDTDTGPSPGGGGGTCATAWGGISGKDGLAFP